MNFVNAQQLNDAIAGRDIRLTADQVPLELRAIVGNLQVYMEAGTEYLYVLDKAGNKLYLYKADGTLSYTTAGQLNYARHYNDTRIREDLERYGFVVGQRHSEMVNGIEVIWYDISYTAHGQTIRGRVYPFAEDSNGNAVYQLTAAKMNIMQQVYDRATGLMSRGYKVTIAVDGKNNVTFTLTKGWKTVSGIYPVLKDGSGVKTLDALEKEFANSKYNDAYIRQQLTDAGFTIVSGPKIVTKDGMDVISYVVSKTVTVKGKTMTLTMEIYPFDKDGNYALNINNLLLCFDAYGELAYEYGIGNVKPKTDFYGNLFFRITDPVTGRYLDVYPFDENGNYIFDIDVVSVMFEAIRRGEDGAYIPVKNDTLLNRTQNSKNGILQELLVRYGVRELVVETRSLWDRFLDWLFGLFGVQRYTPEYTQPSINELKDLPEEAVIQALSSLKESEDIKDSNGRVVGRADITVTGVRKTDDGRFIIVYRKEFFDTSTGVDIPLGEEYFVEYDNAKADEEANPIIYRKWFTDEVQSVIDASMRPINISDFGDKTLENEIYSVLNSFDYKEMGNALAALDEQGEYIMPEGLLKPVRGVNAAGREIMLARRAVFTVTETDMFTGKVTVKLTIQQQNAEGEWQDIYTDINVNLNFNALGGVTDDMLHIDERAKETNSGVVYFTMFMTFDEITSEENRGNFSSGLVSNGTVSRVEHVYNEDGINGDKSKDIYLEQLYGGAYSLFSSYIRSLIEDLTRQSREKDITGDTTPLTIDHNLSPIQALWAMTTRVYSYDNEWNIINVEFIDSTDEEADTILARARVRKVETVVEDTNGDLVSDVRFFDNNTVSMSHQDGILTIRDTESGTGFVFEGEEITANANDKTTGAPIYKPGNRVSEYNAMTFEEMISDTDFNGDWGNNITILMERLRDDPETGFNYKPEDLDWVKTVVRDPSNGRVYVKWAAYDGISDEPVVEITPQGFVDFKIYYEGINAGLRYNLNENADSQVPVNLVSIAGVGTLVIDYYRGIAFIERRDPSGYILERYNLSLSNTELFDLAKRQPGDTDEQALARAQNAWKEALILFKDDWQNISKSENISEVVDTIANMEIDVKDGNGNPTGEKQKLWVIDSVEMFEYNDVVGSDGNFYSAGLLSFLDIPSNAKTYAVSGNDINSIGEEPISESSLQKIDWENKYIYFGNSLTVEGANLRMYERVIDFNGVAIAELEYVIEDGVKKYKSGVFVGARDAYGIPLDSVSFIIVERDGKQYIVPTETSGYIGRTQANMMPREGSLGNYPIFGYETRGIEGSFFIDNSDFPNTEFNPDNIISGREIFYDIKMEDGQEIVSIKPVFTNYINNYTISKTVTYNSGNGYVVATLSRFDGKENDIISGTPYLIQFSVYGDNEVTSIERQLIPKTPAAVYTYVYDPRKGMDVNNYIDPSKENPFENALFTASGANIFHTSDGKGGVLYEFSTMGDAAVRRTLNNSIASTVEEVQGLKYIAYDGAGNTMFEVYDLVVSKPITGIGGTFVSADYYEIVVYDESNKATYGFLLPKSMFENLDNPANRDALIAEIERQSGIMRSISRDLEAALKADPKMDINDWLQNNQQYQDSQQGENPVRLTKIYSHTEIRTNLWTGEDTVSHFYYEYDAVNANTEGGELNVGTKARMSLNRYDYDMSGKYITKTRTSESVFPEYYRELRKSFEEHKVLIGAIAIIVFVSFLKNKIEKKMQERKKKKKDTKGLIKRQGAPGEPEELTGEKQTAVYDIEGILAKRSGSEIMTLVLRVAALAIFSLSLVLFLPLTGAAMPMLVSLLPAFIAAGMIIYEVVRVIIRSALFRKINNSPIQEARDAIEDIASGMDERRPVEPVMENVVFDGMREKPLTEVTAADIMEIIDKLPSIESASTKEELDSIQETLHHVYTLVSRTDLTQQQKQELRQSLILLAKRVVERRMTITLGLGLNLPGDNNLKNTSERRLKMSIDQAQDAIVTYLQYGHARDSRKIFAHFGVYSREVLDDKDFKDYTVDDFVLFFYTYERFQNAKVHMTNARYALQNLAMRMVAQDRGTEVGQMLENRIIKIESYLTNGVPLSERQDHVKTLAADIAAQYGITTDILAMTTVQDVTNELNRILKALPAKPSAATAAQYTQDRKTLKLMIKEYKNLTALAPAKGTASPLLPVIFDTLFRTKSWVSKYLDIDNNTSPDGFTAELTPYQSYRTAPDVDTRPAWLQAIDILGITKSFKNKIYLKTNLKGPVAYHLVLMFVPLAYSIATLVCPWIGLAVGVGGLLAALMWYKRIAPAISSRLQTQSFTNHFGEPVPSRSGKDSLTTTYDLQNQYDKKLRLAKVTLVNSVVMTLLMGVFVSAVKWLFLAGGLVYIAPLAIIGPVGLILLSVVVVGGIIKHVRAKMVEKNMITGKDTKLMTKMQTLMSKVKKGEGSAEEREDLSRLSWQASMRAALISIGIGAGLIVLIATGLSFSPAIVVTLSFIGLMMPLILKLPKLSSFSVWKIFEFIEAKKEFERKGLMETGKTWKEFKKSMSSGELFDLYKKRDDIQKEREGLIRNEGMNAAEAESAIYERFQSDMSTGVFFDWYKKELFSEAKRKKIEQAEAEEEEEYLRNFHMNMLSVELFKQYKEKMVPSQVIEELRSRGYNDNQINSILLYRFAEGFNDIIRDMWSDASCISESERDKFMYKYIDADGNTVYIGGQTKSELGENITLDNMIAVVEGGTFRLPDMTTEPHTFRARERFFEILKKSRAKKQFEIASFDELAPIAVRIPTYNESVLNALDEEDTPSEKLNSDDISPDGSRLNTTLANIYIDELRIFIERLDHYETDSENNIRYFGYTIFGDKFYLSYEDRKALEGLKALFEGGNVDGKIIEGKMIKMLDGSNIPDCAVRDEILFWSANRLQPLGRTLLGEVKLILVYMRSARMLHPEWTEDEIKAAMLDKFKIVVGYQDFWNLYSKNPNDSRVLGVLKLLEVFSKQGYGDFITVPVMRNGMQYTEEQYNLFKIKERKGIASDYEKMIIEKIEQIKGASSGSVDELPLERNLIDSIRVHFSTIGDLRAISEDESKALFGGNSDKIKDALASYGMVFGGRYVIHGRTSLGMEQVTVEDYLALAAKRTITARDNADDAASYRTEAEELRHKNIDIKLKAEKEKYKRLLMARDSDLTPEDIALRDAWRAAFGMATQAEAEFIFDHAIDIKAEKRNYDRLLMANDDDLTGEERVLRDAWKSISTSGDSVTQAQARFIFSHAENINHRVDIMVEKRKYERLLTAKDSDLTEEEIVLRDAWNAVRTKGDKVTELESRFIFSHAIDINAERERYARLLRAQDSDLTDEEIALREGWRAATAIVTKAEARFIFEHAAGNQFQVFYLKDKDTTLLPEMPGVFVGSFGKVEHLSLLNLFVPQGWNILSQDMNMGMYMEQAQQIPLAQSPFVRITGLLVSSFGEIIDTKSFSAAIAGGAMGHADRTFNYVTQLVMLSRMYYGHPSIFDSTATHSVADQGLMVSEDMMGFVVQLTRFYIENPEAIIKMIGEFKDGTLQNESMENLLKAFLSAEQMGNSNNSFSGASSEEIYLQMQKTLERLISSIHPGIDGEQFVEHIKANPEEADRFIEALQKFSESIKEKEKLIIEAAPTVYDASIDVIKLRETGYVQSIAMFQKFASGAGQSFLSYEFVDYIKYASFADQVVHYTAGPGFYEKDTDSVKIVKYVNYVIALIGVSFFSAAASLAVLLGIFGLFMSQTSSLTGFLKMNRSYGENNFTGAEFLIKLAPYNMSHMYTHADSFLGGILKAVYIATGRVARLVYTLIFAAGGDVGEKGQYANLMDSHLDTNIRTGIVALIGLYLIQSPTLIMALPYMIIPFAVIGAVLFYNPGGSVTKADIRMVYRKYKEDIGEWNKVIKQGGVIYHEKARNVEPITALASGIFLYTYAFVFNLIAFLFSKKTNTSQQVISGAIGTILTALGGYFLITSIIAGTVFAWPLIIAAAIGVILGIVKMNSDKKSGIRSDSSLGRKIFGLGVVGIVFGAVAAYFMGVPIAVFLLALGALSLFFGLKGGRVYPYDGTQENIDALVIDEYAKQDPSINTNERSREDFVRRIPKLDKKVLRNIPAVDITTFAGAFEYNINIDVPAEDFPTWIFSLPVSRVTSTIYNIKKASNNPQARVNLSALIEALNEAGATSRQNMINKENSMSRESLKAVIHGFVVGMILPVIAGIAASAILGATWWWLTPVLMLAGLVSYVKANRAVDSSERGWVKKWIGESVKTYLQYAVPGVVFILAMIAGGFTGVLAIAGLIGLLALGNWLGKKLAIWLNGIGRNTIFGVANPLFLLPFLGISIPYGLLAAIGLPVLGGTAFGFFRQVRTNRANAKMMNDLRDKIENEVKNSATMDEADGKIKDMKAELDSLIEASYTKKRAAEIKKNYYESLKDLANTAKAVPEETAVQKTGDDKSESADEKTVDIPVDLKESVSILSKSEESRLSADKPADFILICGNDNVNTFRKVLDLYKRGLVKKIIISGGFGRLTIPVLEEAVKLGIEIPISQTETIKNMQDYEKLIESLKDDKDNTKIDNSKREKRIKISEAEIIGLIMQEIAKRENINVNQVDLIFELTATNTPGNFTNKTVRELIENSKKPIRFAYIQTPLQQLRAQATFNKFIEDMIKEGKITKDDVEGISVTAEPLFENMDSEQILDIIASELARIIIYSLKGDILPSINKDNVFENIPVSVWTQISDLIKKSGNKAQIQVGLLSLIKATLDDDGNELFASKDKLIEKLGSFVSDSAQFDAIVNFIDLIYGTAAEETAEPLAPIEEEPSKPEEKKPSSSALEMQRDPSLTVKPEDSEKEKTKTIRVKYSDMSGEDMQRIASEFGITYSEDAGRTAIIFIVGESKYETVKNEIDKTKKTYRENTVRAKKIELLADSGYISGDAVYDDLPAFIQRMSARTLELRIKRLSGMSYEKDIDNLRTRTFNALNIGIASKAAGRKAVNISKEHVTGSVSQEASIGIAMSFGGYEYIYSQDTFKGNEARLFLGGTEAEKAAAEKDRAVSKAEAQRKAGYSAMVVTRAYKRPKTGAGAEYKNVRIMPNATFKYAGKNIVAEQYLVRNVNDGTYDIQLFLRGEKFQDTQWAADISDDSFIMAAFYALAGNINANPILQGDQRGFGIGKIAMVDTLNKNNIDTASIPGFEGIVDFTKYVDTVESKITAASDIETINEAVNTERIYNGVKPEQWSDLRITARMKDLGRIITAMDHVVKNNKATALIIDAGKKITVDSKGIVAVDDNFTSAAHYLSNSQRIKVTVAVDASDVNFEAIIKKLFDLGFDGVSLDVSKLNDAGVRSALTALSKLSKEHTISVRNNTIKINDAQEDLIKSENLAVGTMLIDEDSYEKDASGKIVKSGKISPKATKHLKSFRKGYRMAVESKQITGFTFGNIDIDGLGFILDDKSSRSDLIKFLNDSGANEVLKKVVLKKIFSDSPKPLLDEEAESLIMAEARGFIKGAVVNHMERLYLNALGISLEKYIQVMNDKNNDENIRVKEYIGEALLGWHEFIGNQESMNRFVENLNRLAEAEFGAYTVTDIAKLMEDSFDEVVNKNERTVAKVRDERAVAAATVFIAAAMNRVDAKEMARQSALTSAATIRQLLSAA
ncbi:MAG: hypothetical protein FWH43_00210 [Endomicrobia bacterium]|nr:hypothetical protein [Endomicrobiia bacterium]